MSIQDPRFGETYNTKIERQMAMRATAEHLLDLTRVHGESRYPEDPRGLRPERTWGLRPPTFHWVIPESRR